MLINVWIWKGSGVLQCMDRVRVMIQCMAHMDSVHDLQQFNILFMEIYAP